jgi:hypothetical protein
MSDDSRSFVPVLIVCGMLGLVCLVVPLGIGGILFVRMQRTAEQAIVAQRDAMAAQQEAMAKLEAERLARQQQVAQPSPAPAPSAPPQTKELTLQERKTLYLQLKQARQVFAALDQAGIEDPALQDALNLGKSQFEASLDQIAAGAGLTRKQLDEIMAEGEREKW